MPALRGRYHEVRGDAYYAKGDKAAALSEYRSAQGAGHAASNSVLDLKIADLAGDAPASAKNVAAAPVLAK